MTQPPDSPQVFEGTDITVDPDELETPDEPATTDAEQLTDDGGQGGVGGENAGGAG